MIDHNINVEQYNQPPVQVEHQIPNKYNIWEQQQLTSFENKMEDIQLNDDSRKILLDTVNTLKIPITLATELFALSTKTIYLIIDDNQSMNADDTEFFDNETGKQLTRMEELKIRLQSIAVILCTLVKFDIKITTLSKWDFISVIPADLPVNEKLEKFNRIIESLAPTSTIPLISATTVVLKDAENVYKEKNTKSILYIFTNGEPNDVYLGTRKSGLCGFFETLKDYEDNLFKEGAISIGISACAGEDNSIGWLADFGRNMGSKNICKNSHAGSAINIQDKFPFEAKTIYLQHGKMLPFNNYGFYITIGLLAPVIPWIDILLRPENFRINSFKDRRTLTKSELSVLTNKQITNKLYQEYYNAISVSKCYCSLCSLEKPHNTNITFDPELKVITKDGKIYRHKVLADTSHNKKENTNNDCEQCTIL